MRVAVTVAPGVTRIEERPEPECGPGEVVCRVLACAAGPADFGARLPAVLGREPAGEVVAVGNGVDVAAVGDQVAIRAPALEPGGFAEYALVPRAADLLMLEGLDPVIATLVEPLAAVLRAQDRAELDGGDALLVVGAGAVGLLHVAAARSRGVEEVLVREPELDRRRLAERWGARVYRGERVGVAIVTTASPRAFADAAETLNPGGRLLLHADPPRGTTTAVDAHTLAARELRITASAGAGPRHARAALALLRAGAVSADDLITARFSLALAGDALAAQAKGTALRAVVLPWA
jgi:L-iditol 2-dehydrogenase